MWGIQIAFKDFSLFKGIGASEWVGFEYFKEFIQSKYFGRVFINTIAISLYGLVICFPAQIIVAIMISEVTRKAFKKTVQTLTFLPHFVSVVVIAGIVTTFLSPSSGLINLVLEKFGFEKIYFLANPDYFRGIFTTMNLWKETGFASIVFIAAIAGIDTQLYEAAKMDGAGKFKQIYYVTLPGILPTIMVMLILKIGDLLRVGYEAIILLYQPATYEKADVISTYVYRSGLIDGRYDFATAVGLFNSIVALVLVVTANKLSKRVTNSALW
ncbi:sugar ABC transporter permease (plasmid) [Paenibacillus cellulosilyticus]|nr:sugar ABC transporter permease [Paenibacillus cellulosilyticus]